MRQNHNRPVFLNLLRIQLPVTGLVSIAHRITGVLWVLFLPILAYLLHHSLESESGFQDTVSLWSDRAFRILVLFSLALLTQHFLSGIRHLCLDLDIGVSRPVARITAIACFVITAFITTWLGVCWW